METQVKLSWKLKEKNTNTVVTTTHNNRQQTDKGLYRGRMVQHHQPNNENFHRFYPSLGQNGQLLCFHTGCLNVVTVIIPLVITLLYCSLMVITIGMAVIFIIHQIYNFNI